MKNIIKEGSIKQINKAHMPQKNIKRFFVSIFNKNKKTVPRRKTEKWLLYYLFLGILSMIYIANVHYAEKNIYSIGRLNKELKEAVWEDISLKTELARIRKQTEIATKAQKFGLKQSLRPPEKIELDKNENKN